MTDSLFTLLSMLWLFACLMTFVGLTQLAHRCRYPNCPHRNTKE